MEIFLYKNTVIYNTNRQVRLYSILLSTPSFYTIIIALKGLTIGGFERHHDGVFNFSGYITIME